MAAAEGNGRTAPAPPTPVRAAQYVRMSTEHQRYSTENQADVIARYAVRHGLEIVRTYADEGKSGLNLEGRISLRQLISDVTTGAADFSVVLVYDISRWGRFQDTDQSAHYEYICRDAGVKVHYCAEQFENDGSIGSTIIKSVKRAMA
jgi:DNA invertase Pin-like site-specific DNA recombinase